MSDSDGDFSDELLELAGAIEKKRKHREGSSESEAKRRKAVPSMDTTSDEEDDIVENPYPLDGKYIDEFDRQRLLKMREIEREEVIAQRLEELQRITDKRDLDQMFKAQKDGVAKAAKHTFPSNCRVRKKSRREYRPTESHRPKQKLVVSAERDLAAATSAKRVADRLGCHSGVGHKMMGLGDEDARSCKLQRDID